MIEKDDDKVGCLPMRWCAGEIDAWYFLKNKHGLVDLNACHNAQGSHNLFGSPSLIFNHVIVELLNSWIGQCSLTSLVIF